MLAARAHESRDRLLAITLYLGSKEGTPVTDHEPMRYRIMASAIFLFARKGYAGTSMRDIATAVGIKAASLYSHCPEGKQQLLIESLRDVFDRFLRYVIAGVRYEMNAREQLEMVVNAHVTWQLRFREQALAWDSLVQQFGISDAIQPDALQGLLETQKLYHEYLDALIRETSDYPERARAISIAVRVLCDQAPMWASDHDLGSEDRRDEVRANLWWLAEHLIQPRNEVSDFRGGHTGMPAAPRHALPGADSEP